MWFKKKTPKKVEDTVEEMLAKGFIAAGNSNKAEKNKEQIIEQIVSEGIAELGAPMQQFNLGVSYQEKSDYEQAANCYLKAAVQGLPEAQVNLGMLYTYGQGVLQDDKEAIEWFRKASDQHFADGYFKLGIMYANGQGVKQDHQQAFKLVSLAAEQGHPEAIAIKQTLAQRAAMERMQRGY